MFKEPTVLVFSPASHLLEESLCSLEREQAAYMQVLPRGLLQGTGLC